MKRQGRWRQVDLRLIAAGKGQEAGRTTVKVLPRPGVLATSMVPPCAAAIDWAIHKPRPAPPPCDFASADRKKRVKIFSCSTGLRPIPVSATLKSYLPVVTRQRDSDPTAGWRIFDGIIYQVQEQPLQSAPYPPK